MFIFCSVDRDDKISFRPHGFIPAFRGVNHCVQRMLGKLFNLTAR